MKDKKEKKMTNRYIIFRCNVDNSTVVSVLDTTMGKDVYKGVAECPDLQTARVVMEALLLREEQKNDL